MAHSPTVALITGGTSGLGLAAARRLMRSGTVPVLFGRSKERGLWAQELLGGDTVFVPGDVTDAADVGAALDAAGDRGALRVVVNCAGTAHAARVVSRKGPHALGAFVDVLSSNLVGTFNVIRLAAERMSRLEPEDGERGVVVNTSSIAAFDGQTGQAAYAAAKAGIAGMTLPLARDLAPLLVRVVTVAPGLFDTPPLAGLPEETRSTLAAHVPHPRRWGRPEEYADLVAHIVGNRMFNGETVRLDGALRMPAR